MDRPDVRHDVRNPFWWSLVLTSSPQNLNERSQVLSRPFWDEDRSPRTGRPGALCYRSWCGTSGRPFTTELSVRHELQPRPQGPGLNRRSPLTLDTVGTVLQSGDLKSSTITTLSRIRQDSRLGS